MATIVTVLTEGFADWETTMLGAVARTYYGAHLRYAAPAGQAVTSSGGMRVLPDLALEAVDPGALDALVICGGTIWQTPEAPDLTSLVSAVAAGGRVIGAICDGTLALARTGVLDGVRHTSNGVGYLDNSGYRGAQHYKDVRGAVRDGSIVTASATAPVSFMAEVMRALGIGDEQLDYYVGMHAAQYAPPGSPG